MQIEFILDVLSRIPKPIVRLRNKRYFTQKWGKGPIEFFVMWLSGSYWKPELVRASILIATILINHK